MDIGVFVGLQFFAAMATVEEEDRVLFRGWFPCIQSIALCVGGLFVLNWFVADRYKSSIPGIENFGKRDLVPPPTTTSRFRDQ